MQIPQALSDEWGRFDLDENLRERLKALWKSPDRALLEELQERMTDFLLGVLRSCDKEDIDLARAQIDAIDTFFQFVSDSVKEPAEIAADARSGDSYNGKII